MCYPKDFTWDRVIIRMGVIFSASLKEKDFTFICKFYPVNLKKHSPYTEVKPELSRDLQRQKQI